MIKGRLFYVASACLSLWACSENEFKLTIPEDKKFSIVMPCQPQIHNESSTFKDYIVQSRVYQCHGLEYAYVITYSEYPIDIYKEYSADELLAEVVKRVEYADPPFEFIGKKPVAINGIKAMEIRSRLLAPRALYRSVIFFAGDGIYQVAYSSKKELFENPKVEAFYASMQLGK